MRTPVVTFAVLLIAGCASEATSPSPEFATSSKTSWVDEFTSEVFYLSDCAGEPVEIRFRERVTAHELVYADGKNRLQLNVHEAGSTAQGLETGTTYKASGLMHVSFLVEPEPAPEGLVAATVTGKANTTLTLTSPGSRALHLHLLFHYSEFQVFDPETGEGDSTPISERFSLKVVGCAQ